MRQVSRTKAEIAWFIYDLKLVKEGGQARYRLTKVDEIYTKFQPALMFITTPRPGKVNSFIKVIQEKLDEQLETPPVNKTIERPF